MAKVVAKRDIRTDGGMLVAKEGQEGRALRNHAPKRESNYRKVAVRWDGRRKVYWMPLDVLQFVDPALDPHAYLAIPARKVEVEFPPLPKPPSPYDFNFGANLRQYRELRGLFQWQVAKKMEEHGVGVAQTTISHWELQAECPNGVYVRALAYVLDIPAFALFLNLRDCRWVISTREYMQRVEATLCEEEPL